MGLKKSIATLNGAYPHANVVPALHFGELNWQRISKQPEADLAAAAVDADVIVAVVGINSTLESDAVNDPTL